MPLELYIGCMFANKTQTLINEYRKWSRIKKTICINFIGDDRYTKNNANDDIAFMYSHNLDKIPCILTDKLKSIEMQILRDAEVILINEIQFFDDAIEFCKVWCDNHNKHIIACGLDGDYKREPMGHILQLISLCDNVTKLKALCEVCSDGTHGIFSWKLTDNENKIDIGTHYISVCRKHYCELSNNQK